MKQAGSLDHVDATAKLDEETLATGDLTSDDRRWALPFRELNVVIGVFGFEVSATFQTSIIPRKTDCDLARLLH